MKNAMTSTQLLFASGVALCRSRRRRSFSNLMNLTGRVWLLRARSFNEETEATSQDNSRKHKILDFFGSCILCQIRRLLTGFGREISFQLFSLPT